MRRSMIHLLIIMDLFSRLNLCLNLCSCIPVEGNHGGKEVPPDSRERMGAWYKHLSSFFVLTRARFDAVLMRYRWARASENMRRMLNQVRWTVSLITSLQTPVFDHELTNTMVDFLLRFLLNFISLFYMPHAVLYVTGAQPISGHGC